MKELKDKRTAKAVRLFLAAFFLTPMITVVINSLRAARWAPIPFSSIVSMENGSVYLSFCIENYFRLITDSIYLRSIALSLLLAFACVVCIVPFGFFLALSTTQSKDQNLIFVSIMIPAFIPFVVKLYSWMHLADKIMIGWLGRDISAKVATWLFCCYSYLPMVTAIMREDIKKIDKNVSDAAGDLGASPWTIIWKIILPLSRNALVTSVMAVGSLAFGEFVIPDLLSGGTLLTIGAIASAECFVFHDLPMSSALALFMMLWSLLPILLCRRILMKIF